MRTRKTQFRPKVINLFSCSTQLSMKFVLLINLKLLSIPNSVLPNIAEHETFSAYKYENANYCWHFHIYKQSKISCSPELSMKKFCNLGASMVEARYPFAKSLDTVEYIDWSREGPDQSAQVHQVRGFAVRIRHKGSIIHLYERKRNSQICGNHRSISLLSSCQLLERYMQECCIDCLYICRKSVSIQEESGDKWSKTRLCAGFSSVQHDIFCYVYKCF